MRRRLLDLVAPVRPACSDRGYRRLLRWAALPVTDRRWAAPLAAVALGFGLFAGVAIGPGTTGTLATGGPQVIELPPLLSDGSGGAGEGGVEAAAEPEGLGGSGGADEASALPFEAESPAFESSIPEVEAPVPAPAPAPPVREEAPEEEAEPEEEAQTVSGVVVHANPAAGSYTVVENGGLLSAVHAAKLPAPGTKVSVAVRTLANGTFAEQDKPKQSGTRTSASIAGIVTFVEPDPAAPAYAVSKRGASVLVHVRPDPAGLTPTLPQLGAYATVEVEIEKPQPPSVEPTPAAAPAPAPACAPDPAMPAPPIPKPLGILWQQQLQADGAPFASSDFAGVVMAVCPGALLLSADDLREAGKDVLFAVPASIDTAQLKLGDSVAATAAIEADGTLKLTGLASDERSKGADDTASAQGDLVSQQPK